MNDKLRPITVKYWGEELRVLLKPDGKAIQSARLLASVLDDTDESRLAAMLAAAIVSWNLENDFGDMAPITSATILNLPEDLIVALAEAVITDFRTLIR